MDVCRSVYGIPIWGMFYIKCILSQVYFLHYLPLSQKYSVHSFTIPAHPQTSMDKLKRFEITQNKFSYYNEIKLERYLEIPKYLDIKQHNSSNPKSQRK